MCDMDKSVLYCVCIFDYVIHFLVALVTFVIKYTLTVYLFSSFNFNLKFDFEIFDKTTVITCQGDWIMI